MKTLLILGLITLISCSSDEDDKLRINGIALNYSTKVPEGGKKIYLELGDKMVFLNEFGPTLTNLKKDSVISDNNGHFNFIIDPEGRTFYWIKMNEDYVRANEPLGLANAIDNKRLITDTLFIGKSGGLRLHIKNDDPNDGDTFSLVIKYENPYAIGYRIIHFSTAWIYGMNPNDFIISNQFLVDINKELIIDIAVTRGEETIQTYHKVNLIEQETVDYLIEY